MDNTENLGFVRSVVFPIQNREMRKFLPLASIFALMVLVYSLSRSLKDMIILDDASAAAIYFLKLFGITPSMIVLTILYSKVSAVTDRDARFNAVMVYFLAFFTLALLFLLPYKDSLKFVGFADMMTAHFPRFLGLWQIIALWPVTLFYIHAEAWGTLALGVAFWTVANEVTSIDQAKRFYASFNLLSAFAYMVTGGILKVERVRANFSYGLTFVIFGIVLVLVLYNCFARDMRMHPECYDIIERPKKERSKLSFMGSLKFLFGSSYLGYIALMLASYGMTMSLFEAVYKSQLKDYVSIMGDKSILADIYSRQNVLHSLFQIFMALFIAAPVWRRGWKLAASVTPIAAFIMSSMFFLFLYFSDLFDHIFKYFNVTSPYMAVQVGLYNLVFIKAAKYILFDSTKEAAYIPLDEESRVRGKAAVDGVGSRLGKGFGSFLVTSLMTTIGSGSIANIRFILGALIFFVIIVWLTAVDRLSVLKDKAEEEYSSHSEAS